MLGVLHVHDRITRGDESDNQKGVVDSDSGCRRHGELMVRKCFAASFAEGPVGFQISRVLVDVGNIVPYAHQGVILTGSDDRFIRLTGLFREWIRVRNAERSGQKPGIADRRTMIQMHGMSVRFQICDPGIPLT